MSKFSNEKTRNARVQFINGLIRGLADDARSAASRDGQLERQARPGNVQIEVLLEVRKRLLAEQHQAAHRLQRPPGFRLVEILKFFCRKKTSETLIEPMHAEFLTEYFSALKEKRYLKATYLAVQMHFYLVYAVLSERVLQALASVFTGRFKAKSEK
jgi:threonine aldolase